MRSKLNTIYFFFCWKGSDDIVQKKETIDDYLTKLMAVSKEDIIECANLIELDTTFLLKGSDNDAKEILPND